VFDLGQRRVAGLPSGEWTTWSAETLAQQYDARATVRDFDAEMRAYADGSAPMYALPQCRAGLAYGMSVDETLDLFPVPGQPHAPLLLFIHGGYWRALSSRESVFMAKALNQQGVAVASVNYSLAPAARLATIVDQCRRALCWLHRHGPDHGVQAPRVVVAGSSAGGHLAAMLLSADWQRTVDLPAHWVTAGVLVSGLFDLAPLAQTTPNTWLNLSHEDVAALSPVHHLPAPDAQLLVAVAETDTPGFKQQSLDYARICRQHGVQVEGLEVAGRNHFNIILDWMDPQSALSQHTARLLRA
jgi:arylformamidase